jgi:hypothetical protein
MFIFIIKTWEIDLYHVLHALSQCLLEDWVLNVIIVDNTRTKINVFRYVDLIAKHVSHDGNAIIMSIGTSFQDVFLMA